MHRVLIQYLPLLDYLEENHTVKPYVVFYIVSLQ
jgi:hypothetical protein